MQNSAWVVESLRDILYFSQQKNHSALENKIIDAIICAANEIFSDNIQEIIKLITEPDNQKEELTTYTNVINVDFKSKIVFFNIDDDP